MLRFLWTATRGYRLRPWASPYLRWRIETYSGLHADHISARDFFRFSWEHRSELFRFLHWAGRMESRRRQRA
jgi:hypothetical protein